MTEREVREIIVYGRRLVLERRGAWTAFDTGTDGKRRIARDIVVPEFIVSETDLARYLADVLHERATTGNAVVEWVR